MSDRFGLLQVPMTGTFTSPGTNAIGDPALDKIAAFLKAAINADTRLGWAAVHPAIIPPETTAVPVVFTYSSNPDEGDFTDNKLPALFVWRLDIPNAISITQDWERNLSRIAVLWVKPYADYEKARFRDAFRNAVAKSITLAIERGRHPSWIVAGDTDPKAADWGSFILSQINATQLYISGIKSEPLTIQKATGQSTAYDALLVTLELLEVSEPLLDNYELIANVHGTVTLNDPALSVLPYYFLASVTSVSPSTGGTAGGTAITITGTQFWENTAVGTLSVSLGGVACTSVVLVNETTITAVTPANTAGAKTLTVTTPSGATATLASAFTYS